MASGSIQRPKIRNPKKEGYLDKQSSFWKTYRKRWMVLQGHMLYSFKEEKVYDNPTEIFDLTIYNQIRKSADGKTGQFEISSSDDSRVFLASSQTEMKNWMKHIKTASKSKKKSASVSNIASKIKRSSIRSTNTNTASSRTTGRRKSLLTARKNTKKKKSKTPNPPKKNTKPKAQRVTNQSMDKHIARMQKMQQAKSKSHEADPRPLSPSKKKKPKKKQKVNVSNEQRSSVPNLLDTRHQQQHTKSHSSGSAAPQANLGVQRPHRRSVSSMFSKLVGVHLTSSKTELIADEDNAHARTRDFDTRDVQSQSDRHFYKKEKNKRSQTPTSVKTKTKTFTYNENLRFYTVKFESKPFGLTLNPFNETTQIGAVVMVNHNVNDQMISQSSRFVSINDAKCKNLSFDRIKTMCRNATLPTTIKFLSSVDDLMTLPGPLPLLTASISAGNAIHTTNTKQKLKATPAANIGLYNGAAPKASDTYSKKQNKHHSPRHSISITRPEKEKETRKDKETVKERKGAVIITTTEKEAKPKKKKAVKQKESQKAKQNREKKAAKQLMESLGGMNNIKSAERYERMRKWKECVECYEKGIEELEKSIKALERSGILSVFQQTQCQQQIDAYCRTLIKLQREHSKDIYKTLNVNNQQKKPKNHSRATTALPKKKKHVTNYTGGSLGLNTKTIETKSYDEHDVDEHDEAAVFGKTKRQVPAIPEENTENNENINDNKHSEAPKKDNEPKEDIYAFLDRSEDTKKHKTKMTKEPSKKTKKKKKTKATKEEKKDKKKKKKKNKDKEDSDDDKKEEDKPKSKRSKQDDEFRSRLEADIISEAPDVCFKDVQGLANVKLALYETIILPALRPELFTGLREPTAGLLLFGPPGNGKTMVAKCVAAGCQSTFFSISASSITSKFVGDAERIMRTLFALAREKAPSIIFIDEIDSMLTARGGKNEAESSRRVKTEFLIQFDGVKKKSDSDKRILVIGATNLPDQLDEAVLRRFGKRIMVPLPDPDTRNGLLRLLMSKQKSILSNDDYAAIVEKCDGYSCSDLATLCKDAAMGPIRSLGVRILEIKDQADMPAIERKHFDESVGNVRPSLTDQSLKYFEDWNDKFGSKIHLSMSALPENMRPFTTEQLAEIERKRDEKEAADKAAREAEEAGSDESEEVESD